MPFFGLGLHILIALYFGIHALRRGHNLFWLIVLFSFPLLGSIVYFIVIYLPELRNSRGAQVAKRTLNQLVDPKRELRDATEAFELTATAANRARLAAALLASGAAAEAAEHYRQCAAGPFAKDASFLTGLAQASMLAGDYATAASTLETLFGHAPETRRQAATSLIYARSLAELGREEAGPAFEAAIKSATGPEAKCRYAQWLEKRGQTSQAIALYKEVIADSRHWHHHAKSINKEWLNLAEQGLRGK